MANDLLKEDFIGLFHEHKHASEEFSGRRFRNVLAIQAVPLLMIGALISSRKSSGVPDLDLVNLPQAAHIVFVGSFLLGEVVRRMWVRAAFLENTYARALNHFRGRYLDLLGDSAWEPWLPRTPTLPNIRKGGPQLALLFSVVATINFLYLAIGVSGLFHLTWSFPLWSMVASAVRGICVYASLMEEFCQDQSTAEAKANRTTLIS